MNLYLQASLENLVETINGNSESKSINTHEEYLQAVEEHSKLTTDLHKQIDDFHKHCDNVDIANAAVVIVEEIKAKGISIEDDMQMVLDIISKNTGINVSNEEVLTTLAIIAAVALVISIIANIIKTMIARKRLNDHIDKVLTEIIVDINNSSKVHTDYKPHVPSEHFNNKFKLSKVPAFTSNNHGDIRLELNILNKATNEFDTCVSKIYNSIARITTKIMIEANTIIDLQNSAVMCITTKTEDKHNEAVKKYKENKLESEINEINNFLIKKLQDMSFSKASDFTALQNEFTLIHKEVFFTVESEKQFDLCIKDNAEKLSVLNKEIIKQIPKIEKFTEQNKVRLSKLKESFEKDKNSKDMDYHKYLVEVSNIGGKRLKELEHEFFSLIKTFNICDKFVQMHYQFIKEIKDHRTAII